MKTPATNPNRRTILKSLSLGIGTTALGIPSFLDPPKPGIELAFEAKITLGPVQDLGTTSIGHRRIIPVTGGTFEGETIKGIVLPGGADWQFIGTDGVTQLEARYTLQTSDGTLIYIINKGIRHGPPEVMAKLAQGQPVDPNSYYFRTSPTFETQKGKHDWLTKFLFISTAIRNPNDVQIRYWKVL